MNEIIERIERAIRKASALRNFFDELILFGVWLIIILTLYGLYRFIKWAVNRDE